VYGSQLRRLCGVAGKVKAGRLVNPWWWVSGIGLLLGVLTYGLAKATSREIPFDPNDNGPIVSQIGAPSYPHRDLYPRGYATPTPPPRIGEPRPLQPDGMPLDVDLGPPPVYPENPRTPAAPDLPEPAGGTGLPGDAPTPG
jgi:hypothetical protein